jgi:uncharacterized membrane protein HdeD (DUF308 family)
MSTDTAPASTVPDRSEGRALVVAGALVAVLGIAAILAPYVAGIVLSILLGVLLVVGGLAHVAYAFRAGGWAGSLWQVALGVLYALAGISLLANPSIGLTTLTVLLIAYFFVGGLIEVAGGLLLRPDPQWGWVVGSGVVSLVLAVLLWAGFPSSADWALGLLVGIDLLSTGLVLVYVGYLDSRPSSAGGGELPGSGSPSE